MCPLFVAAREGPVPGRGWASPGALRAGKRQAGVPAWGRVLSSRPALRTGSGEAPVPLPSRALGPASVVCACPMLAGAPGAHMINAAGEGGLHAPFRSSRPILSRPAPPPPLSKKCVSARAEGGNGAAGAGGSRPGGAVRGDALGKGRQRREEQPCPGGRLAAGSGGPCRLGTSALPRCTHLRYRWRQAGPPRRWLHLARPMGAPGRIQRGGPEPLKSGQSSRDLALVPRGGGDHRDRLMRAQADPQHHVPKKLIPMSSQTQG